jgi:hypothetical protein
MEKYKETIVMKSRSAAAAIKAGFRLYAEKFKAVFNHTWVAALIYAIVAGVGNTFLVMEYPKMMVQLMLIQRNPAAGMPDGMLANLLGLLIVAVLTVVATILVSSLGFKLLREHLSTGTITLPKIMNFQLDRHLFWRTFKAYFGLGVVVALLIIVISAASGAAVAWASTVGLGIAIIMALLGILLSFPLYYVFMQYMLKDEKKFWSTLKQSYSTGMRHYGYVFTIALTDIVISAAAYFVTALPSFILMTANMQAQMGALSGDKVAMPSFMTALTLVVFVIAQFLAAYILLSILFPLYYMWGSIETMEEDKKDALNKMLRS